MANTLQRGSISGATFICTLPKGCSVVLGALTGAVSYGLFAPGASGAGLTASNGFTVNTNATNPIVMTETCDLWAISASGTAQVIVQNPIGR